MPRHTTPFTVVCYDRDHSTCNEVIHTQSIEGARYHAARECQWANTGHVEIFRAGEGSEELIETHEGEI